MSVKIKLYGILRILLKEKELTLSPGNGTLADLLCEMTDNYGQKVKKELLDEEGRLDHSYSLYGLVLHK